MDQLLHRRFIFVFEPRRLKAGSLSLDQLQSHDRSSFFTCVALARFSEVLRRIELCRPSFPEIWVRWRVRSPASDSQGKSLMKLLFCPHCRMGNFLCRALVAPYAMSIDRAQLLSLWKLGELHACDEGRELAARFFEAYGNRYSH